MLLRQLVEAGEERWPSVCDGKRDPARVVSEENFQ